MSLSPLVILGCGYAGTALARLALQRGHTVFATVRDASQASSLTFLGVKVTVSPVLSPSTVLRLVHPDTLVAVCFPPDNRTDALIAPVVSRARAVVYLSSTAVYGEEKLVTASTLAAPTTPTALARFSAESHWLRHGAVSLRSAGIYGPFRGLHRRLIAGTLTAPDDPLRIVSRVHVADLATVTLAALHFAPRESAWPIADLTPVPQSEVIDWLVAHHGLPPALPRTLSAEHKTAETLRHHRVIDPTQTLAVTNTTLRFAGYREGFNHCLSVEGVTPKPQPHG